MRLVACLSLEYRSNPFCGSRPGLRVFILVGIPDVLHHASIVGAVLEDGISRYPPILSCNVLCRRAHLDEGLQENLRMEVHRGSECLHELLYKLAAVCGHCSPEGVRNLEYAVHQALDSRHECMVILRRRVTLHESSKFQDSLVSRHPIVLSLFSFEMRKHISYGVAELTFRKHIDRVHLDGLLRWWLGGLAIDAISENRSVVDNRQAPGRCVHVNIVCLSGGARARTDLREDVLLDAVSHGISFELLLEICFRAITRVTEQLHQSVLCCIAHVFVRGLQTGHNRSNIALECHALFVVHADDPSYRGLLLPVMGSSKRLLSDYALDIAAEVWVDVGHGLTGACSQWFPEVAKALLQDRKDARDELLDGVSAGILDAQSFEKVAEGREGRGCEMRRSLLGDGKLEALEDGRLRALGHAIVLDVGLEAVEGIDL